MTALTWHHFDPPTALRLVAFVYGLMALLVWVMLRTEHNRASLQLWCAGSAAAAVGGMLLGSRGVAPDWMTLHLANTLLYGAYVLRVLALRVELGAPSRLMAGLLVTLGCGAIFTLCDLHSVALRVEASTLMQDAGAAGLAVSALQVQRATGLRAARWIAGAYALFAAAMLAMFVGLLTQTDVRPVAQQDQLGLLIAILTGAISAVCGNFGYIGMALERLRAKDLRQAAELAREGAQRAAAEASAGQLKLLLDERDDLIRVMAHEVRQPLNNASAALQAARGAMVSSGEESGHPSAAVAQRVQRAQSVLSHVTASLDNTLAATALLASADHVAQQDTDVQLLVQLSLGDIDATQVHRVQVERRSGVRTASMDAGLMRLALRNLLSNALAYSDPGTPVTLRISDSDEPLALVFEVIDSGPGVDPDLAPRMFLRGERGSHDRPGHGLGLYVVLRVAELHDSQVEMQHREGGGSVFRFLLVQGTD